MALAILISRHAPTLEQTDIMARQGYDLRQVGDADAFDPSAVSCLIDQYNVEVVVCVHAALALEAHRLGKDVVVFNNVNRAPVGAKPDFHTTGASFQPADDRQPSRWIE